ncbi:unnamed protein product, partial [marine sediment metagenome]
ATRQLVRGGSAISGLPTTDQDRWAALVKSERPRAVLIHGTRESSIGK